MQTFLPYPEFAATAAVLDPRRLGKQRVESLQILRALTRPVYGWKHHPAVLMWQGHEEALGAYAVAICREWCQRGHADTCEVKILEDLAAAAVRAPPRSQVELGAVGSLPPWLGDHELHRSHRSALLRKNPDWYSPLFGDVPDDLPYVWPEWRGARSAERRDVNRDPGTGPDEATEERIEAEPAKGRPASSAGEPAPTSGGSPPSGPDLQHGALRPQRRRRPTASGRG